jgi:fumarate hydratase subunit beta
MEGSLMEVTSKVVNTPITLSTLSNLKAGDFININGHIYTGRDAALPRLVQNIQSCQKIMELEGAVIMHTAVSPAGISPTTSNKEEIQDSIPPLSQEGVRMHIGKGSLSTETISALEKYQSIYVVTPPAAALLTSKVVSSKVVAYPEEGIEAIHRLKVKELPGIIAVAHGQSIY